MKKHQMKYVLTGGLILVVYAILIINPTALGLPADSAETMYTLFPGLFVVIVSVYGLSDSRGLGRVASMIGVGFGLCFFIDSANTLGLISVEMLSGLTVGELQIWVVALTTISGGIVYAYGH